MSVIYLIHPADITDDRTIDAHMSKENAMRAAQHIADQTGETLRVVERRGWEHDVPGGTWTVKPELTDRPPCSETLQR